MTISDIANIVEIIGIFAIVFGIAFGLIQLKQHRKQSRDMAILELARSFEDPEFTEAYMLITSLDPGVSDAELRAKGTEYLTAAMRVGWKFETVGMLIHNRVVPMDAMAGAVEKASVVLICVSERSVSLHSSSEPTSQSQSIVQSQRFKV